MSEVECHGCGEYYTKIGQHWSTGDCCYPEMTSYQVELVTGLLMGDGCVLYGEKNPYITANMVTKNFLEWLDDKLGVLSTGVRHRNMDNKPDHHKDVFVLATRCMPIIEKFASWYDSGGKTFPDDLELTPTILKMWYVSDGHMGWVETAHNPRMSIAITNEVDRLDNIKRMFSEIGFEPHLKGHSIFFSAEETPDILEYMGEAPPDFGYKWCTESYDKYQKVKL